MGAVLRFLAIGMSIVIGLGFIMFALDEMDRGSKTQQQALGEGTGVEEPGVEPAPTFEDELLREKQNSKFREAIDDANDLLLRPFANLVNSPDRWLVRGVPTLLGLLVYGLALGLAANFLPKIGLRRDDWRTAER